MGIILHAIQDVSMYSYPWGPSQAMLDSSASWLIEVPVEYHGGIVTYVVITFGPPFMSMELTGS